MKNSRKFLSAIKQKAKKADQKSFPSLTTKYLKYINKLNKTTMGKYHAFDIDNALNPVIDKAIKKIIKQIRRKISKKKMPDKDLHYLIHRHLEYYFERQKNYHEYLKWKFSPSFIDKDSLPHVSSHNLNTKIVNQ